MTENPMEPQVSGPTAPDDVEDFDAFWQSQPDRKGPRVRIFGEVVQLPPKLPLAFEMEARRLARVQGSDAHVVRRLLGLLGFTPEQLQRWLDQGMDSDQLQVLLAWAPARIEGKDVTLQQVRDDLRELRDNDDDDGRAEGNG